MINNTAMKEKEAIPPREHKGAKDKNPAPDQKVREQDNCEQQDNDQETEISRTAENLKDFLSIVFAIIIAYLCYSLCTQSPQSPKSTVKPDTENMKSKN